MQTSTLNLLGGTMACIFECIRKHVFAVCLAIVFALSVMAVPVSAEDTGAVDDATCLDCHEGLDALLASGPHRLSSQITDPVYNVTCSGCHAGGEKHIDDPSSDNIVNPSRLEGYDARSTCSQCHRAHMNLDNYGFDAHSTAEINCSACHKVHTGSPSQTSGEKSETCRNCHPDMFTRTIGRSTHPVAQGVVDCLSCHRFAARTDDNLAYDLGRICRDCHPEQGGPFLYEHDAANAYTVEGGGCLECHTPHGSDNDRLLKQPGQQLCLQCHYPAGHFNNSAHGATWARYDCQVCHTETHGSFVDRQFLDPALTARFGIDCYTAGCHKSNR